MSRRFHAHFRIRHTATYLSAVVLGFALLLLLLAVQAPAAGATGRTILVVAPHPDDDALIASGVVANALAAGDTVKVVYMTNGDMPDSTYTNGHTKGLLREDEAVNAQAVLGVSESDLIFLGYPDDGMDIVFQNYPNAGTGYTGASGLTATYADRGLGATDYHYYITSPHSHALYNRPNVLSDLDAVLTAYHPDDIYTTSQFDAHRDHYTTYKFVQLALLRRMAAEPSYHPTLHQAIVWTSPDWGATWPLALNPQTALTAPPGLASTGLQWSAREDLPVPTDMQSTNPAVNRKIMAINDEMIEGGSSGFLGKFVHNDEVFWAAPMSMSVTFNGGAQYVANTNVTLNCAVSLDYSTMQMQFRNGTGTWSGWAPYGATRAWVLPSGDGLKTVNAEFQDENGNVLDTSGSVTLDTTTPSGTFTISGGAQYATTTAVTLNNAVSDASPLQMRFSNNGSTWSAWEPYAATKSWTLSSGDGAKTVSAQFQDAAANVYATSDAITLDSPPAGTLAVNGGAAYTATTAVTLNNAVSDSTALQMRFSNDGSTWSAWEPYAATKDWTLSSGDGAKTVSAQFKDAAANVLPLSDTITLDSTLPTGSFAIDAGALYTNTTAATLDCAVTAPTGVTGMRFRNGTDAWSAWEPYAASRSWTLPAGDGTKTVAAEFKNAAGNVFATTDEITLDTTPPTVSDDAGAAWHRIAVVTVGLSAADGGSGLAKTQYRLQGGGTWLDATGNAFTVSGNTDRRYEYRALDNAGNASSIGTCTVRIDVTKPQPKAPYRASARHRAFVTLKFWINDTWPRTGTATATLKITTMKGKTIKTAVLNNRQVNTLLKYRFRCTLKKGSYRFYVYATDAAGNSQSKVVSNLLVVR
jgi:LmbE family N-acetylglucosaminyl deacetylase